MQKDYIKDYIKYVKVACQEGMKPEEVQSLLSEVYSNSDTKLGKIALRLFAKGIGKTKKKNMIKEQQQQLKNQAQNVQQKSYQYVYK